MASEGIKTYLSDSDNPFNVFTVADQEFHNIGVTVDDILRKPAKKIKRAMNAFVRAGYSNLANKNQNEYIRDVGTIASSWLTEGQLVTVHTKDIIRSMENLGIKSKSLAEKIDEQPNNPFAHIEVELDPNTNISHERGFFLLPISFLIYARTNPIEATGALLSAGSIIRDFAYGAHLINPPGNIEVRADALEAHYYGDVVSRYPNTNLSANSKKLLSQYPQGIESLPASMRFIGLTGREILSLSSDEFYARSNN